MQPDGTRILVVEDEESLADSVRYNLERVGDNAVDIGEQVAFLVSGEFREFTDASHPGGVAVDAD